MKITKMKKLKNGKYKLFLENGEEVVTYDDLILEKELLLTKEIDFDSLKKLSIETDFYEIYYKMVKKISTKLRSEKEVFHLLEKESITPEERESIIDKLKKAGLLNDERFKMAYISDHVFLGTDGPYQIQKNLIDLGIDADMDTLFTEEQNEILSQKMKKYIEKKISTNTKYSKYLLKQKVMEALSQKGFEREKIVEDFEVCWGDRKSPVQKECDKVYQKLSKKYEGTELFFHVKQKLLAKGFQMEEIQSLEKE